LIEDEEFVESLMVQVHHFSNERIGAGR
jgi:hypothetical protein